MRPRTRSEEVLDLARGLGFDLAGVAPLRPPARAPEFQRWLREGLHADMTWLEEQREHILDPRLLLEGGKSLLVVGLGHSRAACESTGGARVARYAAGRDYHNVLGRKLRKLARALRARGLLGEWRKVIDAGPLLERSHAAEAGLGFESKAANLLHPRFGPWFFLGELLLDVELEPTPLPPAGSCGTCTACLEACPTGAIVAPGVVDARRCISYHTIENRGPIPHALREKLGPWVFGCDVCSEVCPWGEDAPDLAARFGLHRTLERGPVRWLQLSEAEFEAELEGSPLRRPKRAGLARNAALVLGNRPSEEGKDALIAARADPSPVVREAVYWALSRGHARESGVAGELERLLSSEVEPEARSGMLRAREHFA